MKSVLFAAMLVLPLGCASPERKPIVEAPVDGYRYPVLIVNGEVDFFRGGGEWVDTLYIPESGVVCRVLWDTEVNVDKQGTVSGIERVPRLFVAYGTMGKERRSNPKEEAESDVEPVKVVIPAALAREIQRLAELTRARDRAGNAAARALVENRLVRPPRPRFKWSQ